MCPIINYLGNISPLIQWLIHHPLPPKDETSRIELTENKKNSKEVVSYSGEKNISLILKLKLWNRIEWNKKELSRIE